MVEGKHRISDEIEKNKDVKLGLTTDIYALVAELKKRYGNDQDAINKAMEEHNEMIELIKNKARKFSQSLDIKYPQATLAEKLAHAKKYKKKYGFDDKQFEVFLMYAFTTKRFEEDTFNFPHSEMSRVLGFDGVETMYGNKLNFKAEEAGDLNDIMTMYANSKPLHDQIKMQTFTYRDCEPISIPEFKPDKHVPFAHVHPVVFSMFYPKIKFFEEYMLLASIPNIVKMKYEGRPLVFQPDRALFWYIISDPNESECTFGKTPMADIKIRTAVQVELWNQVMALRGGNVYMPDKLTTVLNACKSNTFDSSDTTFIIDECTVMRRLMGVFSLRPLYISVTGIEVSTIPMNPMMPMNFMMASTPTVAIPQPKKITTVPTINVRLPLKSNTTMAPGILPVNPPVRLLDALAQRSFFSIGGKIQPKIQNLEYTNGVLIFTANRRYQSINVFPSTLEKQYLFNQLPSSFDILEKANDYPIVVDEYINMGAERFALRSVVCVETVDANAIGVPGVDRYIIGTSALIRKVDPFTGVPTYFAYIPSIQNDALVPPAIEPLRMIPFGGVGGFLDKASTSGTVFIYEKQ